MRLLESKHVCPYIPGGGLIRREGGDTIYKLEGYVDGRVFLRAVLAPARTTQARLEYVKPVLKPMTMLEGTIVQDGKEFNAFYALDQMALQMEVERPDFELLKDPKRLHTAPNWQIIVLIGWGFDVFDLIEDELALDINFVRLK